MLVSGHLQANTRETARALGIREVLEKPIPLAVLATTLVRVLERASASGVG